MDAIFDIEKNEMVLIYNENKLRDRVTLGYVKSIKDIKVKEINVYKDKITEQQFMDIARRLNVNPAELFDRQSEEYREKYADTKLSKDDVLKILKHNSSILRTPIAMYHDQAYFVQSPYDFVKTGLAFKGINPEMSEDEYESNDENHRSFNK
jgi:arsenate reductase-like glutaredoxin family protein